MAEESVRTEIAQVRGEMRERSAQSDAKFAAMNGKTDAGFERVDKEFAKMRGEQREDAAQMRGEMVARFERVDKETAQVRGDALTETAETVILGMTGS